MKTSEQTLEEVKNYYGKILSSKSDLKTSACCTSDSLPAYIKKVLSMLDSEILDKFYGCGSPIPADLEGKTLLDLGCGTGRDVYIASYLIGEEGKAIGMDMTPEQLSVARSHTKRHMEAFGFSKSNVEFIQGYNENLESIPDESCDVVISNCVINLSPHKEKVFSEILRVLKPGGELYFSDVFSNRRIPEELQNDPMLYGECLSGAMYIEDMRRLFLKMGINDYRILSNRPIDIHDEAIGQKLGNIKFSSVTVRAFKILDLEDKCEDYGQIATYLGSIPHFPNEFVLDDHHVFEKGRPVLVCGNTASMLYNSRFGRHFKVEGDTSQHFGIFDCAPSNSAQAESSGGCC